MVHKSLPAGLKCKQKKIQKDISGTYNLKKQGRVHKVPSEVTCQAVLVGTTSINEVLNFCTMQAWKVGKSNRAQ
jgi:hypothetical protein